MAVNRLPSGDSTSEDQLIQEEQLHSQWEEAEVERLIHEEHLRLRLPPAAAQSPQAWALFQHFDTDRNGALNRDEVIAACAFASGDHHAGHNLYLKFEALDFDRDGLIDFTEFARGFAETKAQDHAEISEANLFNQECNSLEEPAIARLTRQTRLDGRRVASLEQPDELRNGGEEYITPLDTEPPHTRQLDRGVSLAFSEWFMRRLQRVGAPLATLSTHDVVHGAGARWSAELHHSFGFGYLNATHTWCIRSLTTSDPTNLIDFITSRPAGRGLRAELRHAFGANWRAICFGRAHHFFSHAWELPYAGALEAQANAVAQLDGSDRHVYIWNDIFAINQHGGESAAAERAADLRSLKDVVQATRSVIVYFFPLTSPAPLTRSWCLFELLHVLQAGGEVVLGLPDAVTVQLDRAAQLRATQAFPSSKSRRMSKTFTQAELALYPHGAGPRPGKPALRRRAQQSVEERDRLVYQRALDAVNSRRAKATVPSDKAMIDALIKQSIGFSQLDELVRSTLEGLMKKVQAPHSLQAAIEVIHAGGLSPVRVDSVFQRLAANVVLSTEFVLSEPVCACLNSKRRGALLTALASSVSLRRVDVSRMRVCEEEAEQLAMALLPAETEVFERCFGKVAPRSLSRCKSLTRHRVTAFKQDAYTSFSTQRGRSKSTPRKRGNLKQWPSRAAAEDGPTAPPLQHVASFTQRATLNQVLETLCVTEGVALPVGSFRRNEISSLDLSDRDLGIVDVVLLGALLVYNHSLLSLNLSGNRVGSRGAKALASALTPGVRGKSNVCLHTLILDNICLVDREDLSQEENTEGCEALAQAVLKAGCHLSLSCLSLRGNLLGSDGAAALAAPGLQTLNLADNSVGKEGIEALAAALSEGPGTTTLILTGNSEILRPQTVANRFPSNVTLVL
ncbi:hypothetical protein CYMTET_20115 [Cymbomonas tetramitiformis]|uniref:EF-hand domain-containing protein n=1 Tax=Cymbomonas tetramitiformis TaxID=36881 RepID=A0AAE0L478_9CHLO|nr:hypothetical protein CYMTET_20115 [Cymbomonas tetramitiformis]